MEIGRIQGTTRVIGKSQGYLGLPVRDEVINCTVGGPDTPAMVTAWIPSPAELERLNKGANVYVRLIGTTIVWANGVSHPPIMVEVGSIPE